MPATLDGGVRTAETEARRALRLGLTVAHEKILAEVRQSGELTRKAENESVIRDLLESRMLLYYINEEGWYAPNPLL